MFTDCFFHQGGLITTASFAVRNKVSRFFFSLSRFQGFIQGFGPWGLESEVTFAHDILYEQVHEFY